VSLWHSFCSLRLTIQTFYIASLLVGFTEDRCNLAQKGFDYYGPTILICPDLVEFPGLLKAYEERHYVRISNLTAENLPRCVSEGDRCNLLDSFQTAFLVRLKDVNVLYGGGTLVPMTDSVKTQFGIQVRRLQRADQVKLYHLTWLQHLMGSSLLDLYSRCSRL